MISSMGGYRCCHIQFWNMVIMEKEKRYVASISGGKDSMAMVLGLIPVVGIPLALISYGGTVILSVMASFGIILSVCINRNVNIGK